jgi:hypothetical protein
MIAGIETYEENDLITCSCCGAGIRNNAAENVAFGEKPYPCDNDFGHCRSCFGDRTTTLPPPTAPKKRERAVKRKIGWAMACFFEARFDIVRAKLNPEQQAKWDGFSYEQKCTMVASFVKKGWMI